MQKNAAKVIEGENLDILVGSIPLDGAKNRWQKIRYRRRRFPLC